ncbi:glycosyltransferase involved in cell wall biosynthesis [Pedobacter sp. CG_S7]|uniref:glycosyltransferase family 4 protein n=1 Tax=Pedobacter sp. CG_S7 TaxID=3143930 RepID=UPI003393685D
MRLAIVVTHPIQYYVPVFQLLTERIELKVFYSAENKKVYDNEFQREICWDIPMLSGYNFEWLKNETKNTQISNFQPHCILIYGWSPKSHLQLLRHFKNKVKIIFRGDSTLLRKLPWWKQFTKKIFLTWVYKHVTIALYTGTNNKDYFKKFGLKEAQLIFSPHAIDNERFSFLQDTLEVRKSLGISKTDVLVLFTGKFNVNKNILMLLQAFVEVNVKNTHLLFIGSGQLENELKIEAEKYANVHVLPFQNQQLMPAFYQASDLFCMPSKTESWGLSINEAMACGKAVLASDQCGAAADLVKQENGRIFKSNQLKHFKEQLHYLLSNPILLRNAGKQSRIIIHDWSFKIQVENILKSLYA